MLRDKRNKDARSQHIVVKKKLHSGEEGHHGGIWKIAYADFMTAMMTFFLVMWLSTATSKQKITELASYFNPLKLADRTPPTKGVGDKSQSGNGEKAGDKGKTDQKAAKGAEKIGNAQAQAEDEVMLHDPFNTLAELSALAHSMAEAARAKERLPGMGSSHDPFVTASAMGQPYNRNTPRSSKDGVAPRADSPPQGGGRTGPIPDSDMEAPGKPQSASGDKLSSGEKSASSEKPASRAAQEKAAQLGAEIAYIMAGLPESFRPAIETKATDEGVLISLTDDANFAMFKVASAAPSPQLVLVLEKIGGILGKYPGKIVIRGHTDARPFAGNPHGNWRLSVNRANMTYFMLVRAKTEETRFLAVEGFADRSLKNKADPLAGENRRIEILIKGADT